MAEKFLPPSWLHDQDAETIHKRMMDSLPADIDDTEGGFPWDFTMPTALEKAEMLEYHLVETLKVMFPQWAYGDWLRRHAEQRGVTPKEATKAYGVLHVYGLEGTFIPKGYVFGVPSVGDAAAIGFATLEDSVIRKHVKPPAKEADVDGGARPAGTNRAGTESEEEEAVEEGTYARIEVCAVEPGPIGNVAANTVSIMLSKPLVGIKAVNNPKEIKGGTEEESDAALRERILELDRAGDTSFAGNNADYIRWAKEVQGVGSAYVVPQWDPEVPNSVRLVLLDGNGQSANARMIDDVYNHIMSPGNPLLRKAPIGAILTVAAPTNVTINYAFTVTLTDDAPGLEQIMKSFKTRLQNYYVTAKEEQLIRHSVVGGLLIGTAGVKDYANLKINGGTENINIAEAEYPITGAIDVSVT